MVRWFWNRGPNYEHELPKLAEKINKQRTQVLSAANAHRRLPTLFVQQCLSVYVLYIAYYFLLASSQHLILYRAILVLSPVFLVVFYKCIAKATLWRKTSLEGKLEILVSRRNILVDAYKKKTKYDEIQKLIGEDVVTPIGKQEDTSEGTNTDVTPQAQNGNPISKDQIHNSSNHPTATEPISDYHPSWVDFVLDKLIGVNEHSPANRFALICEKCHSHNGLAPYGKTADQVVYFCPVCLHKNGDSIGSLERDSPSAATDEVTKDKPISESPHTGGISDIQEEKPAEEVSANTETPSANNNIAYIT